MNNAFFQGLFLAVGMICALGPQNLFVIQQGLARQYVGTVVAICSICDVSLIFLGVFGVGEILEASTHVKIVLGLLSVSFLAMYGIQLTRCRFPEKAEHVPKTSIQSSRLSIALLTLSFTLLNPWVYVDTIGIFGALGQKFHGYDRAAFALGASISGVLWFVGIGYGVSSLRGFPRLMKLGPYLQKTVGYYLIGYAGWFARGVF